MGLNNMTQQMGQQQGGMSPEQQSQMQRLAQQQELIKKSLEQLNNEAKASGQSKKIPANIDNMLKDMQEVVTDLKSQKINDQLLQKQEKILSRMLDAQRSINERDYEKNRESESGKNYTGKSPASLKLDSNSKRDLFNDQINKAIREGYKRDYEILIRKYFELMQKNN